MASKCGPATWALKVCWAACQTASAKPSFSLPASPNRTGCGLGAASLKPLRGVVIDAGHSRALGVRGAVGVARIPPRPASASPRGGRASRAPRRIRSRCRPGSWRGRWAGPPVSVSWPSGRLMTLTLRLPSVADGPLGSPELIRPAAEEAPAGRRVALASWKVPVLAFEHSAALTLLPALADLPVADLATGELAADDEPDRLAFGSLSRPKRHAAPGEVAWAGRSATWPRWLVSPATWPPAAGCCPPCRGRRRLRRPLAAGAVGADAQLRPGAGGGHARRLPARPKTPRPGRCWRACSTRWPTPLPAPGCRVPAARAQRPPPRGIPVIERTVASLTGSDPLIELAGPADGRAAAEFAAAFTAWLAGAARPAGPVRTCFRLVEPPARSRCRPISRRRASSGTWPAWRPTAQRCPARRTETPRPAAPAGLTAGWSSSRCSRRTTRA